MKIYIIDAEQRLVREAAANSLNDAKCQAGIKYIEAAWYWPNGDVLYVDEEGMLAPIKQHFFRITDRPDQPLAGNGMVFGREKEVDDHPDGYVNLDPQISLAELQAKVTWFTLEEAVRYMLAIPGPHTRMTSIEKDGSVTVVYEKSWRDFLLEQGFPIPEGA